MSSHFETEIAEPDKDGGALRYRGVNIEDLVGRVSFANVWGLLVDNEFSPGLPPAEPYPLPIHSGDVRVDIQSAIAMLAPGWGLKPCSTPTTTVPRESGARVGQRPCPSWRSPPAGWGSRWSPQVQIDEARTIVERMMIRWRGEPDPAHVEAVDAYFVSAAEHGMNASTFTARVIASTGADVAARDLGAVGAMSGPLHGGPVPGAGDDRGDRTHRGPQGYVKGVLDRGERPWLLATASTAPKIPGPRPAPHREGVGRPRYEVAAALEAAALAELRERRPDRVLETNVEFWAAIVLDFAEVPAHLFTSMFTCARLAGWSAHILEQKKTGPHPTLRPLRRTRPPQAGQVPGWDEEMFHAGGLPADT